MMKLLPSLTLAWTHNMKTISAGTHRHTQVGVVVVCCRHGFQYWIIGMQRGSVWGQSDIMLPISEAARRPHQLLIAFRGAN